MNNALTIATYDDLKHEIKSGDLLAYRGSGFLSRLVKAWTNSDWSHVGIAWVFKGNVFILEAQEGSGVGIRALSHVLPMDWIPTHAVWSEAMENEIMGKLGKKYSYQDAIMVGLGFKPGRDDTVCSLFASAVLRASLVDVPDTIGTPKHLVDHFLKDGYHIRSLT